MLNCQQFAMENKKISERKHHANRLAWSHLWLRYKRCEIHLPLRHVRLAGGAPKNIICEEKSTTGIQKVNKRLRLSDRCEITMRWSLTIVDRISLDRRTSDMFLHFEHFTQPDCFVCFEMLLNWQFSNRVPYNATNIRCAFWRKENSTQERSDDH